MLEKLWSYIRPILANNFWIEFCLITFAHSSVVDMLSLEKSEYAVTPFKLNEMPKINEISHFAHIDYQAFAINDCAACF